MNQIDTKIDTKTNFYQKHLDNRNLYILFQRREYLVTKFEPIGNKIRFFCDNFGTSFGEACTKLRF